MKKIIVIALCILGILGLACVLLLLLDSGETISYH